MLSEFLKDPDIVCLINLKILGQEVATKIPLVQSAFASMDYYKDDLESLCSVYRSLVKNHPFFDGNKRTATIYLIIGLTTLNFEVDQDSISDLTLEVATHQYEVNEIVSKLRSIIRIK